ncbi:gamma-glutamyltransferase family protein [Puniceibacterium sediminis]|uniref:Gamma-glutamyltransferase 2. Threonine peptidase. MEROPS family T03 n=1 Tax=Puniceibacterium sediminis TaxID=1608407 RepID=A0A238VS40_9RHOB|nr:gamma-glutamyltransferase family protein [Puniceibacterium sediminis]SNR37150.1 gamma-glutamyltransferase 2. Threonine peptidase. MEROPS family T03 [Puniceibacterium sediminis]
MTFTTRPEISGTFGVATSTHWIASTVGMSILEQGGNAFDAACAMGFVLQVVEPHLNGPLGDMVALIRPAGAEVPTVLCGQGTAPAAATIAHYRSAGLTLIPGSGLLATVIPGAFDAWLLMLRDHGTLSLRAVLEPAIHYARHGHPMLARAAKTIADLSEFFRTEWPTSHAIWLPHGNAPEPGVLFRNPDLAYTWDRLLAEAECETNRTAQIDAARRAVYQGFIAERIDIWLRDACVMDATGNRRKGVLNANDMAGWQARYEPPLSVDYCGWTVWKAGPWTQGPLLLQSLKTLSGTGIAAMDPVGSEFIHTVTETLKLSFADREAYYGDPEFSQIPIETLLSDHYAQTRRGLIGETASLEQRPGDMSGSKTLADAAVARARNSAAPMETFHPSEKRGDTVHLDVIDRWGNMISATPSGGWLMSSPVVPGLGMALNSRAQMFWLTPGLPGSLTPGARPRTTLTPSMAQDPDGARLAFGTPGGDQQDQWQLIFLLRLIHGGMSLQQAIDAPMFHTAHATASFYPRAADPGHLVVEPSFADTVMAALLARGHRLERAEPWSLGRLTAASRSPSGLLRAAATPRQMQAYAVGR